MKLDLRSLVSEAHCRRRAQALRSMANGNDTDIGTGDLGADRATRRQLRAEIKRTGVTVLALLASKSAYPEGLNARVINRWLSGIERRADPTHIKFVLSRYRDLPDASPGAGRSVPSTRLPLTQNMRDELEAEFIRTCATVASLTESATDLPAGLNARVIRSWVYGEAKSVDPRHWSFVIGSLSARTDATGLVFSTRPEPRRKH